MIFSFVDREVKNEVAVGFQLLHIRIRNALSFYSAFGEIIFDGYRKRSAAARHALARCVVFDQQRPS
jgi:hypothetical protein